MRKEATEDRRATGTDALRSTTVRLYCAALFVERRDLGRAPRALRRASRAPAAALAPCLRAPQRDRALGFAHRRVLTARSAARSASAASAASSLCSSLGRVRVCCCSHKKIFDALTNGWRKQTETPWSTECGQERRGAARAQAAGL